MPRRHNPRALRRQAAALRAEFQRDQMIAARRKRRAARRVDMRLEGIAAHRRLLRAVTDAAVQSRIDAIELGSLNADRSAAGLPPLESIPFD